MLRWGIWNKKIIERWEAPEIEFSVFAKDFLTSAWKTVCGKRELNVIPKLLSSSCKNFVVVGGERY